MSQPKILLHPPRVWTRSLSCHTIAFPGRAGASQGASSPLAEGQNLPAKQVYGPSGDILVGTGYPDLRLLDGDVPDAQPRGGTGGRVHPGGAGDGDDDGDGKGGMDAKGWGDAGKSGSVPPPKFMFSRRPLTR